MQKTPNVALAQQTAHKQLRSLRLCPAVNDVVAFEPGYDFSGRRRFEPHFRALPQAFLENAI
jgi:hypothetical protein